MFIDRAVIEVRAGKGGNGMISFLREKYVSKGGPSGGNGGHGASIILKASKSINNLLPFRHGKAFIGKDGEDGMTKNRYGKGQDDLVILVPVGTLVYDEKDHTLLADLAKDGDEIIAAKGGRGGRGNASFKSATNRVPKVAENGFEGEKKRLILELKLLADVGLIGLPNAGKSTFLGTISNANPKVAPYPFTTKEPYLGVVQVNKYDSFVVADLPGLIKDAHLGKGLGFVFLRHVERCKILLHMVDMSAIDPVSNYCMIQNELKQYGHLLDEKIQIIAATKMDEETSEKNLVEFKKKVKNVPIYPISSLTRDGIQELLNKLDELVQKTPMPTFEYENVSERKIYDAYQQEKENLRIAHPKDHLFVIEGESIISIYRRTNMSTDEGVLKFLHYLDKIGIDDMLKKAGAVDGDTVIIDDFEFEYFE